MNNADDIMRLTEKRNGENVIPMRNVVCGVGMPKWALSRKGCNETFLSGDAADSLAAYEDTGLTPHQIKVLQGMASKDADERVRLGNLIESLCADLVCATEERDAAVADIMCRDHCDVCVSGHEHDGECAKADYDCMTCKSATCLCRECRNENKWQWRGLQQAGEGDME